jgi:hypothetical protein
MIEGLGQVRISLRGPNPDMLHPAERAAEAVLALLKTASVET